MELIEVEICNWDKYNPRTDRTITVWFRFQNDFFLDQKLWGMSDTLRLTFIFLLCEASKIQCGKLKLNLDYLATHRKRSHKQILEDIKELARCGVLSPRIGGREPDKVLATIQDNTKQTIQNNNAHAEAFALFWVSYPRKVGKGKARHKYLSLVRSGVLAEEISKALANYLAYLRREKVESQYIKHGPTFLSEYADWLDPAAGNSESFSANPNELSDEERAVFENASNE